MSAPPAAALSALARDVDGTLVCRRDAAFEGVCRELLWNRRAFDRWPEIVVRVAHTADVVRALVFARAHALRVAVRSGGHSWCGAPLREGSLLLDLGALDEVSVDATTRTATAQPAVTNRTLAEALGRCGLAFPYGHCASVALGGYVLAGGVGWNARAWGLACHNLRALEVVLADGRTTTVSAADDADLLWAARGAGPGFPAIVTRFHLDVHPLPAAIVTSRCVYALADVAAVARWIDAVAPTLPAEVELTVLLAAADGGRRHTCSVVATAFAAAHDDAERALRFMASCPVVARAGERSLLEATPFAALFDGAAARYVAEQRNANDCTWIAAPLADVVTVLAERLRAAPSARTFFLCAIAPVPRAGSVPAAFSPAGDVLVNAHALWSAAAEDAANLAWHADTMARLAPLAAGYYVGEADIATVPSHAARSFAAPTWQRLVALRERYDPGQLLHSWFPAAEPFKDDGPPGR